MENLYRPAERLPYSAFAVPLLEVEMANKGVEKQWTSSTGQLSRSEDLLHGQTARPPSKITPTDTTKINRTPRSNSRANERTW